MKGGLSGRPIECR